MKLTKNVYKNLIGLILLLGFASIGISGKHAYPEFQDTLTDLSLEILKNHGLPIQPNRNNPWFSISSAPGSYTIGLHQSNEIPQQAILDIVKLCMDFYEQRGRKERFQIFVYKETEEQWRKSLMFLGLGPARIKPFFELRIGEKQ